MAGVEVRAARPGSASALATGLTQRGDGGCVEPHDATSEMAAAPASLSNVLPAGGPGSRGGRGGKGGVKGARKKGLGGQADKAARGATVGGSAAATFSLSSALCAARATAETRVAVPAVAPHAAAHSASKNPHASTAGSAIKVKKSRSQNAQQQGARLLPEMPTATEQVPRRRGERGPDKSCRAGSVAIASARLVPDLLALHTVGENAVMRGTVHGIGGKTANTQIISLLVRHGLFHQASQGRPSSKALQDLHSAPPHVFVIPQAADGVGSGLSKEQLGKLLVQVGKELLGDETCLTPPKPVVHTFGRTPTDNVTAYVTAAKRAKTVSGVTDKENQGHSNIITRLENAQSRIPKAPCSSVTVHANGNNA